MFEVVLMRVSHDEVAYLSGSSEGYFINESMLR